MKVHTFSEDNKTWDVKDLWEAAKKEKMILISCRYLKRYIDADIWDIWKIRSLKEFSFHMKLVMESDLRYPIILTPEKFIADGYHRLLKALYLNKKVVKCKVLKKMPMTIGMKNRKK